MLLSPDVKLDFGDVLISPQRSEGLSRANVQLHRVFRGKYSNDISFECVPIIASNMFATGSIKMAKSLSKHNIFTALHKYNNNNDIQMARRDLVFITIGESEEDLNRLVELKTSGNPCRLYINIDVANGYRSSFSKFVNHARSLFPRDIIMAGNVVTPEMTQELILAGADIVKVGIGPGSVCETRKVTGVGYPQLSAIIECANAAHCVKGGYICADGGCKTSGDVAKAFCAGADFVMLGGMLAGTDECDGQWDYRYKRKDPTGSGPLFLDDPDYNEGYSFGDYDMIKKSLKFYGMSSREAMEKHGGADKDYRASEGKCIEVPYKGPVDNVIKEILGGLRSCGTYIGAMEIKHFPKCTTFVRVMK
jgi:GMP reductase